MELSIFNLCLIFLSLALIGSLILLYSKSLRWQLLLTKLQQDHQQLQQNMSSLVEQKQVLQNDVTKLEVVNSQLEEKLAEQKSLFAENEKNLLLQFENLANKVLNEKSTIYKKQSEESLGQMLTPLKEKILEFQQRIDKESYERMSLKVELKHMVETSAKMAKEAQNLTQALKGDHKQQGNWGELVLETILQSSGLQDGKEYTSQGRSLSLKDEEGKVQRPDIIIHLPEGKHLIIDSKVTLNHYDSYVNEPPESKERQKYLSLFMTATKQHIDDLAGKKYHLNEKLITPDFVLMFVPIEGSFATIMHGNKDLFSYAWDKSIIIVSPTTLLATLKTVASIWKFEKQRENAQQIALICGQLYDKFYGFMGHMDNIDKSLLRVRQSYDDARKSLETGKGSIMSRFHKIKELGAHTNKEL